MPDSDLLETVALWLKDSSRTIAFTGAGISTESGIPDFRSPGGVWANNRQILFHEFLASEADRYEYWRQKSLAHKEFASAQPNQGHKVLADWEQQGMIDGVITQNIDGLHQIAGSRQVWELHGTAREVGCLNDACQARFDVQPYVEFFLREDQVPACPQCGGLLKHATVSFGQQLPEEVLNSAAAASQSSELFLALGSSLVVYPAAGMPELAKTHGARLVIINRDPTPLDRIADVVIHAPLGETLQAIHSLCQS